MNRGSLPLQLLHTLNGPVSNTDFQGLLFLFIKKYSETEPEYEFVPHRFGPFSYASVRDKWILTKKGLLVKSEQHWCLTKRGRIQAERSPVRLHALNLFVKRYGRLRGRPLMIEHYCEYPFYATRSEILERVLPNPKQLQHVLRARAPRIAGGLLTFNCGGIKLEAFLNQALQHSVTLVVDLRKMPDDKPSRSERKIFIHACGDMGIRYEHLADLEYDDFKAGTWPDRAAWLATYERRLKSEPAQGLKTIREWQQQGLRVALMDEHPQSDGPKLCVAKVLLPSQGANQGGKEVFYLKLELSERNR